MVGLMAAEGDLARMSMPEVLAELQTSSDGLTGEQARVRLERFGENAIEERRRSALAELLSFFWGPIPWMIEVADLLSAILRHWVDVVVISVLLVVNAAVGFWQEHTAADAVATLKRQLAVRVR
jgi:H+-transporting ATPase